MNSVTFDLYINDDKELTCLLCIKNNCDLCIHLHAMGINRWQGMHSKCLKENEEYHNNKLIRDIIK